MLQRVVQGESLRQIARSYHISYEAVRRVLNAARKELLAGEGAPSTLQPNALDPQARTPSNMHFWHFEEQSGGCSTEDALCCTR